MSEQCANEINRLLVSRVAKGKSYILDVYDILTGQSFRASISQLPEEKVDQKIQEFIAASKAKRLIVEKYFVAEMICDNSFAIVFGQGEAYRSTKSFDELAIKFVPKEIQSARPIGCYSKGWIMRFSEDEIRSIKELIDGCCERTTIQHLAKGVPC